MLNMLRTYSTFKSSWTDWWYGIQRNNETIEEKEEGESLFTATTRLLSTAVNSYGINGSDITREFYSETDLSGKGINENTNVTSSDDEYKTSSDHGFLDEAHVINERVRNIILEDNHLLDTSKSTIRINANLSYSSPKHGTDLSQPISPSSTISTSTQPAGARYLQRLGFIHEYTDSESETVEISSVSKEQRHSVIPLSIFSSPKNTNHRVKMKRATTDINAITLHRVKPTNCFRCSHRKRITLIDIATSSRTILEDSDCCVSLCDGCTSRLLSDVPRLIRTCSSMSESSALSFSLDDDWSEYTLSLPTTEVGDECRESDAASTFTDMELKRNIQHQKKSIAGQLVNESFIDNECFCCQCVVM